MTGTASRALRRHLRRLSPSSPAAGCVPGRPRSAAAGTSLELRRPSAFQDSRTLFSTPCGASGARCPATPEVPPSGFGYPLGGVSPSNPWEPLSAPDTPGLRPTKPCSSTVIEKAFPPFLSALALSPETSSASGRRSDGLIPPWKPYPFSLPDGLDPAGALALLGFRASQALPPPIGPNERLSHRAAFSMLALLAPRGAGSPHPQGVASRWPGVFRHRMPACLAFGPLNPRSLFKPIDPRGLFFPLEGSRPLTKPELLLLAGAADSPNGRE
jgi:hypothetical protein